MELWCNPENENQDMNDAIDIVKKAGESLSINITFVDARTKSEEERKGFYNQLIESLVRPGYSISFALRGASPKDYDFGLKRPMLVIYDNNRILDVYPHQEKVETTIPNKNIKGKARRLISVREYLSRNKNR